MPDGVIYKPCGNRRESVCPSCSQLYKRDAYQIVRAGLVGGKGVPERVAHHPAVFPTLTAPSFGTVHTRNVKRHTCARRSEYVLRKIAGHGSLTTTQRYLHPDRQSIDAAGTALSAQLSPAGPQLVPDSVLPDRK
jgi:hypothetical protein